MALAASLPRLARKVGEKPRDSSCPLQNHAGEGRRKTATGGRARGPGRGGVGEVQIGCECTHGTESVDVVRSLPFAPSLSTVLGRGARRKRASGEGYLPYLNNVCTSLRAFKPGLHDAACPRLASQPAVLDHFICIAHRASRSCAREMCHSIGHANLLHCCPMPPVCHCHGITDFGQGRAEQGRADRPSGISLVTMAF